jgi:CheY-like chemotaxis protein
VSCWKCGEKFDAASSLWCDCDAKLRTLVVLMTSLYKASHFRTEARHVFKVDEYLAKPLRDAELRDALQRVAPLAQRPAELDMTLTG